MASGRNGPSLVSRLTGPRPGTEVRSDRSGDFSFGSGWARVGLARFSWHMILGSTRDVAVKVLKQANPNARVMGRFFREARAVARMDHPNIVSVHDAGFDNGRCWVAYQYVAGQPLWLYRNQHQMDPSTATRIIRRSLY